MNRNQVSGLRVLPEPKVEYFNYGDYKSKTKNYNNEPIVYIDDKEYLHMLVCDTCGQDEEDCICLPSRQQLIFDYRKVNKYPKSVGGII